MTDEIIKQEQPQKKFNWANLPIILLLYVHCSSISMTIVWIPSFIIFEDTPFLNALMTPIIIYGAIWLISIFLCPVSLILQIINKNKTIFDKVLLGINIIFCVCVIPMLIFDFLNGN